MPDPQNATGTATSTPPPDTTAAGPDLAGLRIRPVQPAPESTFQTVKRNLTPEIDPSRASLGSGHMLDPGDSPQQQGEAEYKSSLGTPLEQAYGHAKKFLENHSQHLSEKVLTPFRTGLDNIADELQQAAESGHTKSG